MKVMWGKGSTSLGS